MAEARTRSRKSAPRSERSRPRQGDVVVEEASFDNESAAASEGAGPETRPLCSFALCPICMLLTAAGEARPELLDHVLSASREVLLAVRALIDVRLEGAEAPQRPTRLERLTID